MRLSILPALSLLLLAACEAQTPTPPAPEPAPPPPAPAAMLGGLDLTQPFIARGNEPFWAVEFTSQTLSYSGVDRPLQTAANPGPVISGSTATYTVTTSLNNPLVVTLTVDPTCSDGMSETVYPLSASVVIGTETLTGCAIAL